jgi:P-type Mg2+ transporter
MPGGRRPSRPASWLPGANILTGSVIRTMSSAALAHQVNDVNLFAEIEPNQKEQIILALKQADSIVF